MDEKITTIGSGTMGRIIAGEEAVSLRQTEFFGDILSSTEMVLMATRQKDGLRWLRQHSQLLVGKIVISLMAFVDFETLEVAGNNDGIKLVRIMTDTSFKEIAWSDDGRLKDEEKIKVNQLLNEKRKVKYLGERKDDELLKETIKACQLGWVAQAMAEIERALGENSEEVFDKVWKQKQYGLSFSEIADVVATAGGATEAGMIASQGLFDQVVQIQKNSGLVKAVEESQELLNFAKDQL